MDIGMPKMRADDAAKHIRQEPCGQDSTLVALTGWGQDKDKQKTKEAGFDQHLTKPARPADLRKLFSELGQDCKKSTSETNSPR